MAEQPAGCVEPTQGPIFEVEEKQETGTTVKEVSMVQAKVGKTAPNFQLSGFHKGGFKNFTLSDYKGKWIVVCFYPGDFTFV